ncbi:MULTISPECIES: amylo-alpha-1,6-glucosidase [unclassified Coleofasciculus]|uniref:amylo-alpha-1,6-glucosidase n=1 Tax=unclassified Coleofasciculus TaxID=2692782 RepID=UPI0018829EAD|nr:MULTISPECIES: amylo-alpha-1,6-glucosidase [unclassified Coleofasciculus]MBE9128331.1 amylo-alpha-1,6-glucosidase [Coleofasciculus sp. LEGE 07081]MBE9151371.1 amylo-alpha-1,6-glucosidase [Coleofasciculus sp. LEGE 07092]
MPDTFELYGRTFVPAEQTPIPEWPSIVSERPQPTLTLKDNDLFLITDTLGNINGSLEQDRQGRMGLFCHDTRFLSRLEIQIEGHSPILLNSNAGKGFAISVLCANPRIENHINAETIGVQRDIVLNGALFEEIQITNYNTTPVKFEFTLSFDADFVDLFEIRGYQREQQGKLLRLVQPKKQDTNVTTQESADSDFFPLTPYLSSEELTLAYQGLDGSLIESRIQFMHRRPDYLKGYTAVWSLELESHGTQQLGYRLQPLTNNRPTSSVETPGTLVQAKAAGLMEEQAWRSAATQIRSDSKAFNQVIEQAEQDIYLLRQTWDKGKTISAGVPWFATLFGRDSIIAASQTLVLDPKLARATLKILAHYQGKVEDDWREEEPGKILHEIRLGEMARCQEIPHTPYYGTIDATPLWLMLYAEYYAWTHDTETLDQLWSNALAAMDWIDRSLKESGYLSYQRRSKRGLLNQGWKDSGDCMVKRDGTLATGAMTLCEVQAYVYAAKIRLSELARTKKRLDLADQWQEDARSLKNRFNRDFWLQAEEFCALALDGEGNPVDSITSNPGHCLHLGIFSPEKAQSVAERLLAPDMFSGWGIRTLSSLSPAYNPMGYHIGSVWPHDNALIALGLRSHGYVEQALEVAQGLVDMTIQQPYHRPPELFCGYERTDGNEPVPYPVACSPQAWASGSIFQLLHMMLNLVPNAPHNELRIIEPSLPESINHLSVHNLRVGGTLVDLEFERSETTTACRVIRKRGNLRIIIEA